MVGIMTGIGEGTALLIASEDHDSEDEVVVQKRLTVSGHLESGWHTERVER